MEEDIMLQVGIHRISWYMKTMEVGGYTGQERANKRIFFASMDSMLRAENCPRLSVAKVLSLGSNPLLLIHYNCNVQGCQGG